MVPCWEITLFKIQIPLSLGIIQANRVGVSCMHCVFYFVSSLLYAWLSFGKAFFFSVAALEPLCASVIYTEEWVLTQNYSGWLFWRTVHILTTLHIANYDVLILTGFNSILRRVRSKLRKIRDTGNEDFNFNGLLKCIYFNTLFNSFIKDLAILCP